MQSGLFALRRETTGAVTLLTKPVFTFGRDPAGCDAVLTHPSAARKHFEISLDSTGRLRIIDLSGPKGTFVNGFRLEEDAPRQLKEGDRISYGSDPGNDVYVVVSVKSNANSKIERAVTKLSWLRTECDRIKAKERADGLTANQQKTLDKYEVELRSLEKIISEGIGAPSKTGDDEDDDDYWQVAVKEDDVADEMLDLTARNKPVERKAETYDSLLNKIGVLDEETTRLESKITELEGLAGQGGDNDDDEIDELDKFMAANEKNIHSSEVDKARVRLIEIAEERKHAQALAAIAKPALGSRSTSAKMDVVSTATTTTSSKSDKLDYNTQHLPPPSLPVPNLQSAAVKPSTTKASDLFARPSTANTSRLNNNNNINKSRSLVESADKRIKFEGDGFFAEEDGERESTWLPPTDQRGDGKTTANDKYGY